MWRKKKGETGWREGTTCEPHVDCATEMGRKGWGRVGGTLRLTYIHPPAHSSLLSYFLYFAITLLFSTTRTAFALLFVSNFIFPFFFGCWHCFVHPEITIDWLRKIPHDYLFIIIIILKTIFSCETEDKGEGGGQWIHMQIVPVVNSYFPQNKKIDKGK